MISLVTVTAKYVVDNGTALVAAAGTVTFDLAAPIQDTVGNQILAPQTVVATLDGTGAFSINLAATDDPGIMPTGVTYTVTERVGEAHRTFAISVPSGGGPFDLADIAPIPGSGGQFPYALVSYVDQQVAAAEGLAVAMALVF